MRTLLQLGSALVLVLVLANSSAGAPILWSVSAGGNGHYYDLIDTGAALSWTEAKLVAENTLFRGSAGHLVTITSSAESSFLETTFSPLVGDPVLTSVPGVLAWIGLSDTATEGTYEWVTGEPFSFANWAPGEPNNFVGGDEDYAYLWRRKFLGNAPNVNGTPLWSWNDSPLDPGRVRGLLVEFEGPFAEVTPVPEPSSWWLFAMSLLGILAASYRRHSVPS